MTSRRAAALALCVPVMLALAACSRGEGDQSKTKGARPPAVPVTAAAVEARDAVGLFRACGAHLQVGLYWGRIGAEQQVGEL